VARICDVAKFSCCAYSAVIYSGAVVLFFSADILFNAVDAANVVFKLADVDFSTADAVSNEDSDDANDYPYDGGNDDTVPILLFSIF